MTDLKPCPRCGSAETVAMGVTVVNGNKWHVPTCWGVGACGFTGAYGHSEEDAARLWNTRSAQEPDVTAPVAGSSGGGPTAVIADFVARQEPLGDDFAQVMSDALHGGIGVTKGGEHVPLDGVFADREAAAAAPEPAPRRTSISKAENDRWKRADDEKRRLNHDLAQSVADVIDTGHRAAGLHPMTTAGVANGWIWGVLDGTWPAGNRPPGLDRAFPILRVVEADRPTYMDPWGHWYPASAFAGWLPLPGAEPAPAWRRIEDGEPKWDDTVIVAVRDVGDCRTVRGPDQWWEAKDLYHQRKHRITHWMPFVRPPLPQEDER